MEESKVETLIIITFAVMRRLSVTLCNIYIPVSSALRDSARALSARDRYTIGLAH